LTLERPRYGMPPLIGHFMLTCTTQKMSAHSTPRVLTRP